MVSPVTPYAGRKEESLTRVGPVPLLGLLDAPAVRRRGLCTFAHGDRLASVLLQGFSILVPEVLHGCRYELLDFRNDKVLGRG